MLVQLKFMALITQLLSFFGNHTFIVSFFGAIIGGEETLILLSILASHEVLDIGYVLIFFYAGILVSDSIWYFLGKSKLIYWLMNKKIISKTFLYWDKLLNKATEKSDFQVLFFTKFLYGTRILTLMYLSNVRLKFKSFILYNIIANFVWVSTILLIGWSAGKGISLAADISNNLILYLFLIGIILMTFTILIRILSKLVKKWLRQKQKQ